MPHPTDAEAAATMDTRDRDYTLARETWEALNAAEDYDGPETIMLSTGYAHVWLDGDVTQHGRVVFRVTDATPDLVWLRGGRYPEETE